MRLYDWVKKLKLENEIPFEVDLLKSIRLLNLPPKILDILIDKEIYLLGDLITKSEEEILSYLGKKGLTTIKRILKETDYWLEYTGSDIR